MANNEFPNRKPIAGAYCDGCGENTHVLGEYYMVTWTVWSLVTRPENEDGMLCIGCCETLLGRELEPSDFADCPLNRGNMSPWDGSSRLRQRLGNNPALWSPGSTVNPECGRVPAPGTSLFSRVKRAYYRLAYA